MSKIATADVARRVAWRGTVANPLTNYSGILLMHGMARLALATEDEALLERTRGLMMPFVRGELEFNCNFLNYRCGGNGAAFLLWQGKLPEAAEPVRHYADELLHHAPRTPEGIFTRPANPEENWIWIDVAFAVTPFLLFAGLAFDEPAYIEEGFKQTSLMVNLFRDPENGLVHQSKNKVGPGVMTPDHWGRGNGWAMIALAEMANYLPDDAPQRPDAEKMFRDFLAACLNFQDENGMWHQEITRHDSYAETSGTGLILYGLGVALEKGLAPTEGRERFVKGLEGFLRYIALDGSVHHTCRGCHAPGNGTIEDYMNHPHVLNDYHAFGPPVLAFGQAHRIGVAEVEAGGE